VSFLHSGDDLSPFSFFFFCFLFFQIWERSTYDAEANEWTIPSLKPRKEFVNLSLPSLGGGGAAAPDDAPRKKEKERGRSTSATHDHG
jgi:hypothetical protein